ncbi:uncharacterized protein [Pseudorca crassidens]|uniref:uncharacterized protein isoform X2 n=1 Tax=Pseudorca crassidens TaxID=82174 RepID=UPI00352F3242
MEVTSGQATKTRGSQLDIIRPLVFWMISHRIYLQMSLWTSTIGKSGTNLLKNFMKENAAERQWSTGKWRALLPSSTEITFMCISGGSWTLRVEDPCDPGPEHLHAAVFREVVRDPVFMYYLDNLDCPVPNWLFKWAAKKGFPTYLKNMVNTCDNYPRRS